MADAEKEADEGFLFLDVHHHTNPYSDLLIGTRIPTVIHLIPILSQSLRLQVGPVADAGKEADEGQCPPPHKSLQ